MRLRIIGLSLATMLLAVPVWAQTRSQMEMQRQEQMRRERDMQMRDAQMRTHANPSVTTENLRDSYRIAAEQRENRATKLSAEDYRELARQRRALDEAIRQVERGGNVSASEVDRILGNDTVY
ncbi:MAG TPA: hypothetical protein VFY49_02725 [Myxococcota bacterium]|nr:hypothetical protein [Myxococcota bacterium]